MKKTINLGGKDYEYDVNFRLSYSFLKYRNKIKEQYQKMDFDSQTLEEINKLRKKVADKNVDINSMNDEEAIKFMEQFTDEEKKVLSKLSDRDVTTTLDENDIFDITTKFTNITEEEEILKILDYEVENYGFDALVNKLITAVSEVFTIAKVK
jgi:hypothetical protein